MLENIKQSYLSQKEMHSLIKKKKKETNLEELWIITKDFDVAFCQCIYPRSCLNVSSLWQKKHVTPLAAIIYVLWQLRQPVSPAPSLPLHHQNSCSNTNTHTHTDSCMHNDEFLDTLVRYSYRDMFRHECHLNHTHSNIHTGT